MDSHLQMSLTAEVLPGPLTLRTHGSLTVENMADLLAGLRSAIALKGCPTVTLDLRKLEHIDPDAWRQVTVLLAHHASHTQTPTIDLLPPPKSDLLGPLQIGTPP